MTARQELADYCAALSFDAIPEVARHQAKLCLLDHLSLMVASARHRSEDNVDIARVIGSLSGRRESSIVGRQVKVPCLHAALVNTHVASDTGLDAIHKSTIIHLSAALVPATLAVAERQMANGKELIAAIVAGAEVMARVGMALGTRGTYARGFHPTSVCAPFGCAASAGKLLGLDARQFAEAFSAAAVLASGSPLIAGEVHPTTFYLQIGRGAESGVLSAMLAAEGLTGPEAIFEDEQGFLSGYSVSPSAGKLTEGIGRKYEIGELIFKKYGVGIYLVTTIEALEMLLRENGIRPESIERIDLELPTTVMPRVGFPEYPANRGSTRISARYIMAVNACLGTQMAFSMSFSDAVNRDNPAVRALFEKTSVTGSRELDKVFPEKKPCILTVRTASGREYRVRRDGPFKGDPENPLSEAEIEAKFDALATPVIGREQTTRIKKFVRDLDRSDDVSGLVGMLAG